MDLFMKLRRTHAAGWCVMACVVSSLGGTTPGASVSGASVLGASVSGGALWAPPLGAPLRVIEPFDAPPSPYAAGHRGFDLPSSPGDSILSPAGGEVTFAGVVVDRPVITVRIDERTVVSLEPVTTDLVVGDVIGRGAPLGQVADDDVSGGHCAMRCVHLGVRVDGEYVNPMRFFAGRPKLLPW